MLPAQKKGADFHNYSYDYGVRQDCCCGLHVRTGALVIGIVGVLGSLTATVIAAVLGYYPQMGIAIATLFLYSLLVVACEFKQPALMVPFLVMNFVGVMLYGIIYIISLGYLFLDLIAALSNDYTSRSALNNKMVRWLTFFQMVAILLSLVIGMWFETIVYRAYRAMKEDMADMPSTARTHVLSSHFLQPATFKKSPPGQIV